MVNKYIKMCSNSVAKREMQIKTTMYYVIHYAPTRKAKIED